MGNVSNIAKNIKKNGTIDPNNCMLVFSVDNRGTQNLVSNLPPQDVIKFLQNMITTIQFQAFEQSRIVKP